MADSTIPPLPAEEGREPNVCAYWRGKNDVMCGAKDCEGCEAERLRELVEKAQRTADRYFSSPPPHQLAFVIANALYRHRYPRATADVADRDHPSQGKFWKEADDIIRALPASVVSSEEGGREPSSDEMCANCGKLLSRHPEYRWCPGQNGEFAPRPASVVGDASEGGIVRDNRPEHPYSLATFDQAVDFANEQGASGVSLSMRQANELQSSLRSLRAELEEARKALAWHESALRTAMDVGARRLEILERVKLSYDEMWGGDNLGVLMDDVDAEVTDPAPAARRSALEGTKE